MLGDLGDWVAALVAGATVVAAAAAGRQKLKEHDERLGMHEERISGLERETTAAVTTLESIDKRLDKMEATQDEGLKILYKLVGKEEQ